MMADKLPWENIRAVRVLELLKEAVGLWHRRHTEMMGVLPREHPVKIQGLSLSLIFTASNAHLAPSLPLSEVTAEKFQWCPRRRPGNNHPSVHPHLCVCIRAHDWPYVQTTLVCLCFHSYEVHIRICMWLVDHSVASVSPSEGYQIPAGWLRHHFASQTAWCKTICILASPLWLPLCKVSFNTIQTVSLWNSCQSTQWLSFHI